MRVTSLRIAAAVDGRPGRRSGQARSARRDPATKARNSWSSSSVSNASQLVDRSDRVRAGRLPDQLLQRRQVSAAPVRLVLGARARRNHLRPGLILVPNPSVAARTAAARAATEVL